jgi:NAD+-processing family protein with receiver domain
MKRILVLEDDIRRIDWFTKHFNGAIIDFATTADAAINLLKLNSYEEIYLDHDLLPAHYEQDTICNKTTGLAVAEFIADNNLPSKIFIHSLNPSGAKRIYDAVKDCNAKLLPINILSNYEILT